MNTIVLIKKNQERQILQLQLWKLLFSFPLVGWIAFNLFFSHPLLAHLLLLLVFSQWKLTNLSLKKYHHVEYQMQETYFHLCGFPLFFNRNFSYLSPHLKEICQRPKLHRNKMFFTIKRIQINFGFQKRKKREKKKITLLGFLFLFLFFCIFLEIF